jgi:hypothetical protein
MSSITATPAHQTIQELPLTANQSQNQPTIQEHSPTDNFIPKAQDQVDCMPETNNSKRAVIPEEPRENRVNQCINNFSPVNDNYKKNSDDNVSWSVEPNVIIQENAIKALSIIDKESIPIYKTNELGPLISELIDKGNGRLFVVTTSQGFYSEECYETYNIDEIDNLQKKVYQLIEDNTTNVSLTSAGGNRYRRSYPSVIYSDSDYIKKQKQQVNAFTEAVKEQNKDDAKIKLTYNTTHEIPNNTAFQKEKIGHSIALDIMFKDNKLTIICSNSFPEQDSGSFNRIHNISDTLHNINKHIKDKNISTAFLVIPLATEEKGTDCILHSFHFAQTSKHFAEEMKELHEGLATKNQDIINTFLTDKFPQEFFAITQKEKNFTDLKQEIFKDENNEDNKVLNTIRKNNTPSHLFLFHEQDRAVSMFFNEFATTTQDIMPVEKHQELTNLVTSLKTQPEGYDYPFVAFDINTTLFLKFKEMLSDIKNFIESPLIFLLSSKDFNQLFSLIQQMHDVLDKNYRSEDPKILGSATKFYNDFIKNQDEYAYKKAIKILSSEELQQIKAIIPEKNSINRQIKNSSSPLNDAADYLSRDDVLELPNMLDLLSEKINSPEIEKEPNNILYKDTVSLVKRIESCLSILNINTKLAIRRYSKEGKIIIEIGDKIFCLREAQNIIQKLDSSFKQLYFLLSTRPKEKDDNRVQRHSKRLIDSWQTIKNNKSST